RRLIRLARALPPLPGPVPLGLFLVAIVVGQRAERLKVLGAMEREPAQGILAVERAAADAEVRGRNAARHELDAIAARRRRLAGLAPARIEMRSSPIAC